MNIFRIEVIFRKYTNFTCHNTGFNSEISRVIELVTDRCDIEPILSDYNVVLYKIIDCDNKVQIMSGFRKIPSHYYELERVHIKTASKIIADIMTARKITSSLS